jgi:hypothetical protein
MIRVGICKEKKIYGYYKEDNCCKYVDLKDYSCKNCWFSVKPNNCEVRIAEVNVRFLILAEEIEID